MNRTRFQSYCVGRDRGFQPMPALTASISFTPEFRQWDGEVGSRTAIHEATHVDVDTHMHVRGRKACLSSTA